MEGIQRIKILTSSDIKNGNLALLTANSVSHQTRKVPKASVIIRLIGVFISFLIKRSIYIFDSSFFQINHPQIFGGKDI